MVPEQPGLGPLLTDLQIEPMTVAIEPRLACGFDRQRGHGELERPDNRGVEPASDDFSDHSQRRGHFREPDSFMGFLLGSNWLTMGMILSLPVLAFGAWLVARAYRTAPLPAS